MKKLLVILALLALPLAALAAIDFTFSPATVDVHVGSTNSNMNLSNYISLPAGVTFNNFGIAVQGSKTTASIVGNNLSVTGNTIGSDAVNVSATAYNATNPSETLTKYVIVNVNVYNTAPTFVISSIVYPRANVAYSQQVASDADNDVLTIAYDKGEWSTAITIVGNNVTFTPSEDDVETIHQVIFNVTDPHGAIATKTVDFIVADETNDKKLVFSEGPDVEDVNGGDFVPGDAIDVTFKLKNELSNVDINGIGIEVWLEDSSGEDVGDSIELDTFDLGDGKTQSEDVTLTILVDTEEDTLYLFVRAEGDDDDDNGATRSVLYVEELKIKRADNDVAFDSVTINPDPAVCGQSLEITTDIWNVGTEEEKVKLHITSSDLSIDKYSELFDLDNSGDDRESEQTMTVLLGSSIKPGNHTITVSANYNSGKDTEIEDFTIDVVCSGYVAGTDEEAGEAGTGALTFAENSIDGKQGQQVKFTATLKNTGATAAVYTFELSGIQDWASGFVEPDTVTLAGGASTEIFVYVTPKTSATGDKTATLTAKSGGTVIETETLTVKLPAKPTLSITSLGNMPSVDNTAALVIVAGIIVVIGLIILGKKRAAAAAVETYGNKRRGRKSPEEE